MYLCAEVYHISHTEFLSWDEGDRQKALAWELRKRQTCPNCGTRPDEWQGGERLYKPDVIQCIGCRELSNVQKSVSGTAREYSRVGLRRVVKVMNGGKRSS